MTNIPIRNWKIKLVTEQEKVKQIVEKYDTSLIQLTSLATAKEVKIVFKFFADEANSKQRDLVGLKDKDI